MKRIIIIIAALIVGVAIGVYIGAEAAILSADYWSDGEGFYEIAYFGGRTIHSYEW